MLDAHLRDNPIGSADELVALEAELEAVDDGGHALRRGARTAVCEKAFAARCSGLGGCC